MLLSLYLLSLNRFKEYHLLFSIERDGTSMDTFYNQVKQNYDTFIIIMDEDDEVFGSYTEERWTKGKRGFYGNGETFIFKFHFKKQKISKFQVLKIEDDDQEIAKEIDNI